MRNLSLNELQLIHGGGESSVSDAITSAGIFSTGCSVIGGALGAFFYYETLPTSFMQTALLSTMHANVLTLPIATFAGFGIGGLLGAGIGLAFYYSGLLVRPE